MDRSLDDTNHPNMLKRVGFKKQKWKKGFYFSPKTIKRKYLHPQNTLKSTKKNSILNRSNSPTNSLSNIFDKLKSYHKESHYIPQNLRSVKSRLRKKYSLLEQEREMLHKSKRLNRKQSRNQRSGRLTEKNSKFDLKENSSSFELKNTLSMLVRENSKTPRGEKCRMIRSKKYLNSITETHNKKNRSGILNPHNQEYKSFDSSSKFQIEKSQKEVKNLQHQHEFSRVKNRKMSERLKGIKHRMAAVHRIRRESGGDVKKSQVDSIGIQNLSRSQLIRKRKEIREILAKSVRRKEGIALNIDVKECKISSEVKIAREKKFEENEKKIKNEKNFEEIEKKFKNDEKNSSQFVKKEDFFTVEQQKSEKRKEKSDKGSKSKKNEKKLKNAEIEKFKISFLMSKHIKERAKKVNFKFLNRTREF